MRRYSPRAEARTSGYCLSEEEAGSPDTRYILNGGIRVDSFLGLLSRVRATDKQADARARARARESESPRARSVLNRAAIR